MEEPYEFFGANHLFQDDNLRIDTLRMICVPYIIMTQPITYRNQQYLVV